MRWKKLPPEKGCGTWFQGCVEVPYSVLVATFGPPHSGGDGYKTSAEWYLWFEDGTIATIYDWKQAKCYDEYDGLDTCDITGWHIGGCSAEAVEYVKDALPLY